MAAAEHGAAGKGLRNSDARIARGMPRPTEPFAVDATAERIRSAIEDGQGQATQPKREARFSASAVRTVIGLLLRRARSGDGRAVEDVLAAA